APGLEPVPGRDRIAVHRVAHPRDLRQLRTDLGEQCGQPLTDLAGSHTGDEAQATRGPLGVELVDEAQVVVPGRRGAELHTDRIVDAGQEVDVRAVDVAGALTD